jgi:transposase InsO family protein
MTELCEHFGISRKTGYKMLERYAAEGEQGLRDRSRAPRNSPQRTDPALQELLLASRRAHPYWGARKIRKWLVLRNPALDDELPAASTAGELFKRNGLVTPRAQRQRGHGLPFASPLNVQAPNEVWSADFKGEFRTGDRKYCYPFTLADAYSRYLLSCRAQTSTHLQGVRKALVEAFRRYGLPQAIRTDNGPPFVGHGQTELTSLGVWWIQLGIRHQRIERRRPDQNGRHERMHRTLKAETARPPKSCLTEQQQRFDEFRAEFNDERPHESLGQTTPASVYTASARPYPETPSAPEYPGHFETRKVDAAGIFTFRQHRYFLARPLRKNWIGLLEIDDNVWSIRFYDHELGRINPRTGTLSIKVLPISPV